MSRHSHSRSFLFDFFLKSQTIHFSSSFREMSHTVNMCDQTKLLSGWPSSYSGDSALLIKTVESIQVPGSKYMIKPHELGRPRRGLRLSKQYLTDADEMGRDPRIGRIVWSRGSCPPAEMSGPNFIVDRTLRLVLPTSYGDSANTQV